MTTHSAYASWKNHVKHHQPNDEPFCRQCRNARVRWVQEWRRRNGVGSHHWPVTLPPGVEGLPSFGVVLAESFRGAA